MNTANPAMAMPMQIQGGRAYPVKPSPQDEVEAKEISTEQIQAMLDENSNLIVEIINLNNEIKQAKGTGQQSETVEKLDKKRKKLNKNLMTLAKWADESSDQPQRPPPPPQYVPPPQYASRGMPMNPMTMAPQMTMGHPQMQVPRFNPAQMQAQAQALAQAQYHARMSSIGSHPQYAAMNQAAPRYHDPSMAYGGMAPPARPMGMAMPGGYAGGPPMGYSLAPQGYGMMAPQQAMQRMQPGPDGSANVSSNSNPPQ